MLIVVASHLLTAYFGRDGSLVVFVVYFVTILNVLTSLRPQYKLLVASSAISVLLLEALLSLNMAPQDRFAGLPDYDDLVGEYGEGGFLVPNLDTLVVGDTEPARFVTNRLGFRDRSEVSYTKPPGTVRIMFIGDSFVSGFRTDQDDTVGKVLEDELRSAADSPNIEVLVVGAAHPGAYLEYLRTDAFRFHPDLIVIGLTIGNDISHSYGARTGTLSESDMFTASSLPRDAFTTSSMRSLAVRLDRALGNWRIYRRLSARLRSDGIATWARDVPFDVHPFGPNHSLGHFYAR